MMRLILYTLLLVLLGVPIALCGIVVMMFEDEAAVARAAELTPDQIERAKRILKAHDPRTMPAGALRTFSVTGDDLGLALNFVLAQRGGGAKLSLQDGAMTFFASVKAPSSPFGQYVNVESVVRQTSALPAFDRLRVGRVPIPNFIADFGLARAMAYLNGTEVGTAAADTLHAVRFSPSHVEVEYQWHADLPDRLRRALLAPDEEARLRAYHDQLVTLTSSPKLPRQVSLATLVRSLNDLAQSRGAAGDPAAENRAAIIVLTFYVNGRGLAAIVPGAKTWPRLQPRSVTLAARGDFAQHFTISAALAATAGSPLSEAIGVYKEVADARGGSGFSFADIAADRAGTVFGERATRSPNAARTLQQRIAASLVEADIMPPAADLPEGMREDEFNRRFGGVGAPPYQRMLQEIDARVARLALYR
jgi:hypothetical protein